MNTLVIVLVAAVLLVAAYVLYGRWLANKWGIDPKAKTPARKFEDGQDYVPTDGWTVFSHQFSSIAGAGPVTGAIQAAVFGWVPVLLWVLIGGIFFGAVTDFGALYASVKNDGKSMGLLIEKYIGKLGRKLFLLFCWLFTLLVIAAFADMVAGTFNAYVVADGVASLSDAARTNGAAGTISLLFIGFAMIFGLIQKKTHFHGWKETVTGLICTVAALAIGMMLPIIAGKDTWTYITFAYIFFGCGITYVAVKATSGRDDHLYVHGYDRRSSSWIGGSTSFHESSGVYWFHNEHSEICSRFCLLQLPVVQFPDSTVWFPAARLQDQLKTKRICLRSDTVQWYWKVCWLCWLFA